MGKESVDKPYDKPTDCDIVDLILAACYHHHHHDTRATNTRHIKTLSVILLTKYKQQLTSQVVQS